MFKKEIAFSFGTINWLDWLCALKSYVSTKNKSRPYLKNFQMNLAEMFGAGYNVFTFFRGRSALYAILKSLNLDPDDEVIIPGFTCVPVPNAVVFSGARPIYADVEKDFWNVNLNSIRSCVSSRTKAIIIQHSFGYPVQEMEGIVDFCIRKNIYLIEDCCHALGVTYKKKRLGTFGDASFFSTERSKMINTIYGGFAVIKDNSLLKSMENIYEIFDYPDEHIIKTLLKEFIFLGIAFQPYMRPYFSSLPYYLEKFDLWKPLNDFAALRVVKTNCYECRFSESQAAIGLRQLYRLKDNLNHRQKICQLYYDELSRIGIQCFHGIQNFPLIRYPFYIDRKKKMIEICRKRGLNLGQWFESCIHPLGVEIDKLNYREGQCPNAENVAMHVVNLPTHPGISYSDAYKALEIVQDSLDEVG